MATARWLVPLLLVGVSAAAAPEGAEPPRTRYAVEEIVRLETTSARPLPGHGRVRTEPVTVAVEARTRFILEQTREAAGKGSWRFTHIEVEDPRTEPAEAADSGVEHALALGLAWMQQLEGRSFRGDVADLPAFPLGESAPTWLTDWLRWAQTGNFSGVEGNPVPVPPDSPAPAYRVEWLRGEFRQAPCSVQEARWTLPVEPAPAAVAASLAAEGVQAQTLFAAQSLEWVTQDSPTLVHAVRSGVRETFWNMEKVSRPELRDLVFRLRLAVQVRVERLPAAADGP